MNGALAVRQVLIAENHERLCEQAAQRILSLSEQKIKSKGFFTLILAGGSTPRGTYERMAGPEYRDRFQWDKIHFFWGDERWVSPEDPRSNYRMVKEALLSKINISPPNIHPIETQGLEPMISASRYEEALRRFFGPDEDVPRFDLILLGTGPEGHTASIFPDCLCFSKVDRLVLSVFREEIVPPVRITITLRLINQAEDIMVLASGAEKAAIVKTVLEEGEIKECLPIRRVKPVHGNLVWLIDRAAASGLSYIAPEPKDRPT